MIIKQHIYNKVRSKLAGALFLSLSFLMAGCSDFLDLKPMDKVVLENFWTEKGDVTAVLNSCYESLSSNESVTRMGVWGELRSENLIVGNAGSRDTEDIVKEAILSTNSFCNWEVFYRTINRCNILCHYAPEVQKLDPNYTEKELKSNLAEAVAIRSLCYFYLIRAFQDVPYTTEPSIDDTQNYYLPATPFNEVLTAIIADLESVKDDAVRRYDVERTLDARRNNAPRNSCRITRWGIYAMLADMYLWQGNWDKVIECCNAVLDYKKEQYLEYEQREGEPDNVALFADSIPLIMAKRKTDALCGNSYNEIFGYGCSFESLFELYFKSANEWVRSYYSNQQTVKQKGRLAPYEDLRLGVITDDNHFLFKKTDCRAYESVATNSDGSEFWITKYVAGSTSFSATGLSKEGDDKTDPRSRSDFPHWIVYRLTDVVLMKAEAMIERGGATDYAEAFKLIDVVNRRANNRSLASDASVLVAEEYTGEKSTMEDLVMAERHREFLFEGKRWFDLVRQARRDGDVSRLVNSVSRKYKEGRNAKKTKLTSKKGIIYFPYYREELKANPLLTQNPAYADEEKSDLTR